MLKGRIIALGQSTSGTKKTDGQPWRKQEYILETASKYPQKVCFYLMNDKIDSANIQIGCEVEIEFDPRSREYNGKWYTELMAWRVTNLGFAQPVQQPEQRQPVFQQQAPQGYAPSVTPTTQFGQPVQQSPAVPQSNNSFAQDDSMPF